jgi:hypothetical protein
MSIQYKLQKSQMTGEVCAITIIGQLISIPMNPDNTDYQAYLKWVAEGNTVLPADENNNG